MSGSPGILLIVGWLLLGLPPGQGSGEQLGDQVLTDQDQDRQDDYYYYEDDDYSRIVSLLASKLRQNEENSENRLYPEVYQNKWSGYVDEYPDEALSPQHKRASGLRRQRGVVPGCVRRGANCDHRPTQCCLQSACRCNLWGANCRCQRRGLFQKWGK